MKEPKQEEGQKLEPDLIDIPAHEKKRIREAIGKTDTEKFHVFTRLMRVHFMLKNAVIIK